MRLGRCGLDAFAHGDVLLHALQLGAVGFALGGFGGEGLGGLGLAAELLFELLDAGGQGDERIG